MLHRKLLIKGVLFAESYSADLSFFATSARLQCQVGESPRPRRSKLSLTSIFVDNGTCRYRPLTFERIPINHFHHAKFFERLEECSKWLLARLSSLYFPAHCVQNTVIYGRHFSWWTPHYFSSKFQDLEGAKVLILAYDGIIGMNGSDFVWSCWFDHTNSPSGVFCWAMYEVIYDRVSTSP